MIEQLIASSQKPRPVYPDSGPGSTTLIYGDETLGLFGTLTAAEFLTGPQLVDLTGSPATTGILTNPTWVKMMMNGRILFIPDQPVSTGGSWEAFYSAGLVYGDRTTGKYPIGAGVPQENVIAKGNSLFIVRLFGKDDPDPVSLAAGSSSNQLLKDYELGRFIAATYRDNNNAQLANSWNLFSGYGAWSGTNIYTIPTYASNVNQALHRYVRTPPILEIQYYNKVSNISGRWWPVLELMPSDTLLAIGTPINTFIDTIPIAKVAVTTMTYEEATAGEALRQISVNDFKYDSVEPKPVAITSLKYEA